MTAGRDIERRSDGTFAPGNRANPGGRPKQVAEVVELSREQTTTAIERLVEIANNPKAPAVARVRACEVLLDRAWGRPAQALDVTGMGSQVLAFQLVAGESPRELERGDGDSV